MDVNISFHRKSLPSASRGSVQTQVWVRSQEGNWGPGHSLANSCRKPRQLGKWLSGQGREVAEDIGAGGGQGAQQVQPGLRALSRTQRDTLQILTHPRANSAGGGDVAKRASLTTETIISDPLPGEKEKLLKIPPDSGTPTHCRDSVSAGEWAAGPRADDIGA